VSFGARSAAPPMEKNHKASASHASASGGLGRATGGSPKARLRPAAVGQQIADRAQARLRGGARQGRGWRAGGDLARGLRKSALPPDSGHCSLAGYGLPRADINRATNRLHAGGGRPAAGAAGALASRAIVVLPFLVLTVLIVRHLGLVRCSKAKMRFKSFFTLITFIGDHEGPVMRIIRYRGVRIGACGSTRPTFVS